jgi:hypothetical protein
MRGSLLFNIVVEILGRAIKKEKEIKGILIGKEKAKLFIFADDILYLKDSKDSIRRLLDLIYMLRKIAGCKINIQN